MKFSIALGLLFAGFAHSQQVEPLSLKVDSFLRQSQHLKPSAQLISIKQNGQLSIVTYKDGPMSMKYDVRTQEDNLKIIGIEQIVSFQNNSQFQPISVQEVPANLDNSKLPPLPLIMPQWTLQQNGQLNTRNVFDEVDQQLAEMEKKMEEDRLNFQRIMQQKRLEMQQRFDRHFKKAFKETPLLGTGDHDYNAATNAQSAQPLIGGGHDYNWATQKLGHEIHSPILRADDHDKNWATIQFAQNQPLLGADQHDFNWKIAQEQQLIGGGDHDNWVQNKKQNEQLQFDHPIIGGDDRDNWQQFKRRDHKNNRDQNHIEKTKHRNQGHHQKWNGKKIFDGKEQRHHASMGWMNRQFTNEQVSPYLKDKLPDMMENSKIILIENKGFTKSKGFPLDIQIKDKQGNIQSASVYFRPRKQELLINKISTISKAESHLEAGKDIVSQFVKGLDLNIIPVELQADMKLQNTKDFQIQDMILPKFIPQIQKPTLLGGKQDPDSHPDFMKIAEQIEFEPDNHITVQTVKNEGSQLPLLGGQTDPDHTIQQISLLGGSNDPDHITELVQKTEQIFDVTGLPLPGGETDVDQKVNFFLINKIMEFASDIFEEEEMEDIDEVQEQQEHKEQPKREQFQLSIK